MQTPSKKKRQPPKIKTGPPPYGENDTDAREIVRLHDSHAYGLGNLGDMRELMIIA